MIVPGAGVAWALYTLRGMRITSPSSATTGNFVRAAPIGIVLGLGLQGHAHASVTGITLAVVSGRLTSAIGFVVSCSTIRRLTAMCAAAVQLLVPPVAALGGVLFLHEHVSARLVLSSIVILIGISLTLSDSSRHKRQMR
ncbi:EamA family transporter [Paraburkholderia caffeinitolerans]|uniref:EamA family transporter n=1 Tax=Paraburkholderia caffeinitolerans TaxID=1723730 RepID=UPI00248385BF|nr:EamA family transporter [Paraburkholderia caffeinitolerans]